MSQSIPTQEQQQSQSQPLIFTQRDRIGKSQNPAYSMAEIGMINRKSQIRGTATGLFGGVIGALLIRNLFKRTPNATVMGGLLIGSLTGYISTTLYVQEGMKILEEKNKALQNNSNSTMMNQMDLQASQNPNFEAGVAGLHQFHDKYQTTRGDH